MVDLTILGILLLVIYKRIKYLDDGRYLVKRLEYMAIHVRFPIMFA